MRRWPHSRQASMRARSRPRTACLQLPARRACWSASTCASAPARAAWTSPRLAERCAVAEWFATEGQPGLVAVLHYCQHSVRAMRACSSALTCASAPVRASGRDWGVVERAAASEHLPSNLWCMQCLCARCFLLYCAQLQAHKKRTLVSSHHCACCRLGAARVLRVLTLQSCTARIVCWASPWRCMSHAHS